MSRYPLLYQGCNAKTDFQSDFKHLQLLGGFLIKHFWTNFLQLPERPDGEWGNFHGHNQAMSLPRQVKTHRSNLCYVCEHTDHSTVLCLWKHTGQIYVMSVKTHWSNLCYVCEHIDQICVLTVDENWAKICVSGQKVTIMIWTSYYEASSVNYEGLHLRNSFLEKSLSRSITCGLTHS